MKPLATIAFMAALLPFAAAFADDTPDAGAAVPQETIAPPSCKKPVIMTKVRKADGDTEFNEKAEAYKDCMNAYANAQNDLAQKHADAATAAVKAFNDFVKDVDAHKDN